MQRVIRQAAGRRAARRRAATLPATIRPRAAPAGATLGRAWLAAGDAGRARWKLARQAHSADPSSPTAPVLLALELMPGSPRPKRWCRSYLADATPPTPTLRLAYAARADARNAMPRPPSNSRSLTRRQPPNAQAWLTLGALQLELQRPRGDAAEALRRAASAWRSARRPRRRSGEPACRAAPADRGLTQAWLLLAQAAEQRGDYAAAEAWLARIDNPQRALEVQRAAPRCWRARAAWTKRAS